MVFDTQIFKFFGYFDTQKFQDIVIRFEYEFLQRSHFSHALGKEAYIFSLLQRERWDEKA